MQFILSILIALNVLGGIVLLYYFFIIRAKERNLHNSEDQADARYHHIVDETLAKERQILDDATSQADEILTGAEYINHQSKEEIDKAIKILVAQLTTEADSITKSFTTEYTGSLKHLTMTSMEEFHSVMVGMQAELKKQIKEFHESLLPQIEKELEAYKQEKMKSIDQTVMNIIQKASQDIFNKSLTPGDHQSIVTGALEKAKKEGVFD